MKQPLTHLWERLEAVDKMFQSDRERYFTTIDILNCIGFDINPMQVLDDEPAKAIKDSINKELKEKYNTTLDVKKYYEGRLWGYRYPLDIKDPIADIKTKHKRLRNQNIERLVQLSTDLFPSSWLADLIGSTKKVLQENNGAIIGFNQNKHLNQIRQIPEFFSAIENKTAVRFTYCPGYQDEAVNLIFHPHFIKEYNQRWFVFGKAFTLEGKPAKYSVCGIDRILGNIQVDESIPYIKNKTHWDLYFQNIIGVTKKNGAPQEIEIETMTESAFHRLRTKPLPTQHIVREHHDSIHQNGIITLNVIPNQELITQLISYRAEIRVTKPDNLVKDIKVEIEKMHNLYS